ncbi:alpha-ketoglutarate-dependent dioxygenase AlkB family protein [Pseudomonas sp. Marseille-Q8238]
MDLFADSPLQLPNAELDFMPQWLDASCADEWFRCLQAQTPWEQPNVVLHGREYPVPRLLAWYGEAAYGYSGLMHRPQPWTPLLQHIRQRIEAMVDQPLNGALLNYYRDGNDSMGWHSDEEPVLGRNPLIASLNLGGTRRFDLRRKGSSRIEHSLELGHGALLVMRGTTQHYWQHQVAKTRKPVASRINLTFRLIGHSHEQR